MQLIYLLYLVKFHIFVIFFADVSSQEEIEKLLFHPRCGNHSAVINGGRSAHRPNAVDDFNNGVVLTSRYLRPNEMFDVRIDKLVDKWAGSIEIGVTTHSPLELDFPSTMTNIRYDLVRYKSEYCL